MKNYNDYSIDRFCVVRVFCYSVRFGSTYEKLLGSVFWFVQKLTIHFICSWYSEDSFDPTTWIKLIAKMSPKPNLIKNLLLPKLVVILSGNGDVWGNTIYSLTNDNYFCAVVSEGTDTRGRTLQSVSVDEALVCGHLLGSRKSWISELGPSLVYLSYTDKAIWGILKRSLLLGRYDSIQHNNYTKETTP